MHSFPSRRWRAAGRLHPGAANATGGARPARAQAWFWQKGPAEKPVADIWKLFSGDRAFADVKAQVDLGPRPAASMALDKTRQYMIAEAGKGRVEDRAPGIRGRHAAGEDQVLQRDRALRGRPDDAAGHRLLALRHEAVRYHPVRGRERRRLQHGGAASSWRGCWRRTRDWRGAWSWSSSTGKRRSCNSTRRTGFTAAAITPACCGIPGGRAVQVRHPVGYDGTEEPGYHPLAGLAAGTGAGHSDGGGGAGPAFRDFTYFDRDIYDDHVPLGHIARVPTIDLIDFNYPPWHTADDTLDKLGHRRACRRWGRLRSITCARNSRTIRVFSVNQTQLADRLKSLRMTEGEGVCSRGGFQYKARI